MLKVLGNISLCIANASIISSKSENNFTCLQRLSPEELRIAKVCNFVRRHKAGEMTDDNTWTFRRVLYSVPVAIFVEDNKDQQFFHAIKLRIDIMKQAKLARRSGSQVVDEIISL